MATTGSAVGIRWNLTDLFLAHDDPGIEQTLNDCHARAEAFGARFRPVMDNRNSYRRLLLDAAQELEIIYEALGRGQLRRTALRFGYGKSRLSELSNTPSNARPRFVICRAFSKSNGSSADETIANRLIGNPALRAIHYLRACAAFARTRFPKRKRRSSMKRTILAATPSAAFFRDHFVTNF
jgi:hypothetical protein